LRWNRREIANFNELNRDLSSLLGWRELSALAQLQHNDAMCNTRDPPLWHEERFHFFWGARAQ
jgi:hypothetical protein